MFRKTIASNSFRKKLQKIEATVIKKSWADEDYKSKLMTHPRAILEQELGKNLPPEIEIKVIEESFNTLFFVLHCNPAETESAQALTGEQLEAVAGGIKEDGELSDDDLDIVSGGGGPNGGLSDTSG